MGKPAVQGQGQGRGRAQISTNEELCQYKKSGIWKYYRKAGFQIKSSFIHNVKELCMVGIRNREVAVGTGGQHLLLQGREQASGSGARHTGLEFLSSA